MLLSQAIKKSTCRKTLASPANTPKPRAVSVTPSIFARASFSRQATTTPLKQQKDITSASSRHEENDGEDDASEHGSEINIVEQIVDKKVTRSGGALYCVRWLGGTSDEDNTWEPEESLIKKYNCRHLVESYERQAAEIGNQQGHASSSDSNHPSPIVPTTSTNQPASSKPHSSGTPTAHQAIESDSSDYSPSPSPPRDMAPTKAKKVQRAVKGPRIPVANKKKTASTASTIPADEDDDCLVGYDNVPADNDEEDGQDEMRDESEDEGEEEEEQSGDAEPVYEVEKILNKCFDKRKQPLYQVKWKGYEEKTWEPKSSFKTCDAMLQNFEAKIKNMKQKPLPGSSSASRARSRSRARSVANRSRQSVSSTPKTPAPTSIMPPPALTTSGSTASSKRAPSKQRGASMERNPPSAAPRQQPVRKASVGAGNSVLGDTVTPTREKPARMTHGIGSGGGISAMSGPVGDREGQLNTRGHDFTATVAKLGGSNKRARSSSMAPAMRSSIGGTPTLATMGAGLVLSAKKARKDIDGQSTSSNGGGRSHEPSPPSATNSSSDAGTMAPVRTLELLDGTKLVLTDSFKIEAVMKVERGNAHTGAIATVRLSDGSEKLVGTAHLSTKEPEKLIYYYERYLHLDP